MRSPPSLRALSFAPVLSATIASAHLFVVVPAGAQSAADKGTARDLAIQGIQEFNEGQHQEALDKLERAQALFDAHVHLVYIARCQVALGKLVEGAESYRALLRKPVPADASDAVRQAQRDGAAELEALEPRIPRLRIDAEPADAPDLQLSINGRAVSAATLGVERPANPGEAVIRIGATGYKTGEQTVTLVEGGRQAVTFVLVEGEGGGPVIEGQDAGVEEDRREEGRSGGEDDEPMPEAPVNFVLEPRFGGVLPTGKLRGHPFGKVVRGGGGGELRFGVNFLTRFTGMAFVGMRGLAPVGGYEQELAFVGFDDPNTPNNDETDAIDSGFTPAVALLDAGVGFRIGSPHRRYGWFAEIDLFAEWMGATTEITVKPSFRESGQFRDCSVSSSLTGAGVRLAGGGIIPVRRRLQLAPYAGVAFSSFEEIKLSGNCEQERTLSDDSVHGWLGIGMGGQFLLGK